MKEEGARVDTPSFLWKEVPRRGGGWMGKAVFPYYSLPRVGKVASGASRIGFWRHERQVGKIVSSTPFARVAYPPLRGPPSPMGKATIREYRFSRIVRTNTRICGKTIPTDQAFPAWGRWRAERAG